LEAFSGHQVLNYFFVLRHRGGKTFSSSLVLLRIAIYMFVGTTMDHPDVGL